MAQWYRQLGAPARNFAFVADLTVASLGGGLKTKQKISGRLADALSELYMLGLRAEALRGRRPTCRAIATSWRSSPPTGSIASRKRCAASIDNFPDAPARWADARRRVPARRHFRPAPDYIGAPGGEARARCAGEVRDRLTRHIYISKDVDDPTGLLEVTLEKVIAAEASGKEARTCHSRTATSGAITASTGSAMRWRKAS